MEIPPIHVHAARRPPLRVAFTRTTALITIGIGVGVVATLPASGGSASTTLLAAALGTAGGIVVYALPGRPIPLALADGLLAVAVLASAFGRPGILYLPSLLAFVAVTARSDRATVPVRTGASGLPATLALAAGWEEEPSAPLRFEAEETEVVERPIGPGDVAFPVHDVAEVRPRRSPEPGRHRAPSAARRAARLASGAGRALGSTARAGLALVRAELTPEAPAGAGAAPGIGPAGRSDSATAPPRSLFPPGDGRSGDGRNGDGGGEDEVEAFWLAQVASGTTWTPHPAYRQLTALPYRGPEPRGIGRGTRPQARGPEPD